MKTCEIIDINQTCHYNQLFFVDLYRKSMSQNDNKSVVQNIIKSQSLNKKFNY